jgi:methylthioribose-1-phosphate isomerase
MKVPLTVQLKDSKLYIINQTKLPLEEEIIITDDYERIAVAIEKLEVRGAPAIGVTAAYALALSFKIIQKENIVGHFDKVFKRLASTRPTAVNLFNALDEMRNTFEQFKNDNSLYERMIERAVLIHDNDIKLCDAIATNGLSIFKKKCRVLTHCNAGSLATGGNGTAVNVIRHAFENGFIEHVYVDETRPLFQGSRLTAWELKQAGIPFSINTDSAAAFLMQQGKVDLVITGSDRIAVNGDAANKIGTYNLAVLCNYHKIPFYIAAPTTTIDKKCSEGSQIKIELRDKKELTIIGNKEITDQDFPAYCPAFDVTPNNLISAIITEKQLHKPPFDFSNV